MIPVGQDAFAATGIPYLYCIVCPAARSDVLAAGRPCQSIDHTSVAVIAGDFLAAGHIPDLYRLIKACRGDLPSIRRPRNRCYSGIVTPVDVGNGSAGSIPYIHHAIMASRGYVPPVRRPRHGVDHCSVAAIGGESAFLVWCVCNLPGWGKWRSGPRYFNGYLSGLAGLLKGISKILDASKTLVWIFGKCLQHHCFESRWNAWLYLAERRRRIEHMLNCYFLVRTIERARATEPLINRDTKPLINRDCQCVLIARWTWVATGLFRCHVGYGTR